MDSSTCLLLGCSPQLLAGLLPPGPTKHRRRRLIKLRRVLCAQRYGVRVCVCVRVLCFPRSVQRDPFSYSQFCAHAGPRRNTRDDDSYTMYIRSGLLSPLSFPSSRVEKKKTSPVHFHIETYARVNDNIVAVNNSFGGRRTLLCGMDPLQVP